MFKFILFTVVAIVCLIAVFFVPDMWLKALLVCAAASIGVLVSIAGRSLLVNKEKNAKVSDMETMLREREMHVSRIDSEKVAVIGKFSSIIAHELRNPLSSLKNVAYFFKETKKFEGGAAYSMLELLSTEVDRINSIVSDICDLSKNSELHKEIVKMDSFMEVLLGPMNIENNIRITRDIDAIELNADPDKLKRLMTCLISNARNAMPEGGEIVISVKKSGDSASITVKDTGCGMDKTTLTHAFEPLFTTRTKALGLGLTMAKEIVSAHKGTIKVESEQGKGTLFHISLPL